MPQFTFSATDALGNKIEGAVFANDLANATEQVSGMGYTPTRVAVEAETLSFAAVTPSVSPLSNRPSLVVPAAGAVIPQKTLLSGEVAGGDEARKEPWERGGRIEMPLSPPPVATLNAAGNIVPNRAAMPTPPVETSRGVEKAGSGRSVRAPFGGAEKPPSSVVTRFKEVFIYPISAGVPLKDLVAFYRQFATLINAGLSLYQSLSALEGNSKNPKLKEIARLGQKQVEAGGRLSHVFAAYPWIFPPMHVEMIRAAEEGGLLDQVLRNLADYVEHELEVRRMISRETLYPKIVLFMALMILGKPGILSGSPAIVGLVFGDSGGYFANTLGFGAMLLAPFVTFHIVFRLFLYNVKGVREGYDAFKMRVPVIGGLVRTFAVARFARTFAALYRGGFIMGRALEIAGAATGNAVIENAVRGAIRETERGGLASHALRSSGLFSHMTMDMFQTGETTGNLDVMMDKVADYLESEGKSKTHQASMIFGVVVFLIVALLVGMSVIRFYSGYGASTATTPEGFDP